MKINRSEIKEQNGEAQIGALAEYTNSRQYLWYRVNARYGKFLTTERMDGFVVALLPLAMIIGEDLYIDGAMSRKTLLQLNKLLHANPLLGGPIAAPCAVVPARLDSGRPYPSEGGVVAGFSGGIDSFCVVADHLRDDIPSPYRITHFVFSNVGAFGKAEQVQKKGIFYRKGIPSEIYQRSGKLMVKADDELLGEPYEEEADLVVLATGLTQRNDADHIRSLLTAFPECRPFLFGVSSETETSRYSHRRDFFGRNLSGAKRYL